MVLDAGFQISKAFPVNFGAYLERWPDGPAVLPAVVCVFDVVGPSPSPARTLLKAPISLAPGKRSPSIFLGLGRARLLTGDFGAGAAGSRGLVLEV